MQGTWLPSLVWEAPTCHGAAKPVRHNYWAYALEPVSHNYWAHAPQLLKPACLRACALQLLSPRALGSTCCNYWARVLQLLKPAHLEPVLRNKRSLCTTSKSSPCSLQLEKARAQQRRPNAAKKIFKKVKNKIVFSDLNWYIVNLSFYCYILEYRLADKVEKWFSCCKTEYIAQ